MDTVVEGLGYLPGGLGPRAKSRMSLIRLDLTHDDGISVVDGDRIAAGPPRRWGQLQDVLCASRGLPGLGATSTRARVRWVVHRAAMSV